MYASGVAYNKAESHSRWRKKLKLIIQIYESQIRFENLLQNYILWWNNLCVLFVSIFKKLLYCRIATTKNSSINSIGLSSKDFRNI